MNIFKDFDSAHDFYNLESNELIQNLSIEQISGWYKIIDNTLCALGIVDSKLNLIWQGKNYLITDHSRILLENGIEPGMKSICLFEKDNLIVRISYNADVNYSEHSPFEYLDDEEFDWGLFLFNVINNKSRKMTFIENLSKGG